MPSAVAAPQTLYDKVLRDHTVDEKDDGTILLYIGTTCLFHFRPSFAPDELDRFC